MQRSTPEPVYVLYQRLGDIFLAQEQWPKAADCYRQAIAHHAQDRDIYLNLAIALQFQNQHEAALDIYQTILERNPDHAIVHNNMGRSLVFMHRFEEAIASYQQAVSLNPNFELARNNLGHLWQQHGYHHQAIASFQEALKLNPQPATYSSIGVSWLALGEPQRALAYFRQAILPQKGFVDAYCRTYGVPDPHLPPNDALYLARSAGVQFLSTLLVADPEAVTHLANAYCHWGDLLIQDGGRSQQRQAERLYTQALQINPSLADAYPRLSVCLQQQGRSTAATLVEQASPSSKSRQPTAIVENLSTPLDCATSEVSLDIPHDSSCAGLNCTRCLKAITKNYVPKRLESNIYVLTGPGLTDDGNLTVPLDVVTLPNGRFWSKPYESIWKICNAIAVFDQENHWIASRSREYPGQLPNCSHPSPLPERALASHQYPIHSISGRVATVSGLSGHVYFHWMIDILPRLELLRYAGIELSSLDGIVVNSQQRSFQRETLQLFGIPQDRIIESDRHPHIQADELIVPAFQGSLGWAQPWTLKILRDRILPHVPFQKNYPKRIYISRADATYRKVLNETDVIERLTADGFVSVCLAGRSVVEQAALFHHANVIIAPHGSSLTNLAFCRPGTIVVEVTSPHYVRPYYWDISRQLGLHHLLVYADVLHCDPVRRVMSPNPLTEDLWIKDSTLDVVLTYLRTCDQKRSATLGFTLIHPVRGSSMLPYLKDAIASCEKAFQQKTDTFQTSRTLGNMLQAQGLFDEAMMWHTLSVHPEPDLAEVYGCFGQLYASQNYWNESIAAYQKALAENPKFAEAHWGLAEVYSKMGDAAAEVRHRQQAIALQPKWKDAESQFLMGNAYLAQESLEDAIAAYQTAIEQRPEFLEAHSNLGTALLRAERYTEAIAAYQAALALNENHAPSYHGIGSAFEALENFEGAIEHYQQAIALQPDFSTYQRLGNALKQQKRWEEAANAFQKSTDLNPDFPWAHHSLGAMYLRMGKPQQAIAPLQKAVQLKPENTHFFNTLGNALVRANLPDEAIASYKQTIGLAADADIELFELGKKLRRYGYVDACIACYQQAILENPMQPKPYIQLQYTPVKEHQLKGLIDFYRQIQASGRNFHPVLWSNLGDLLTRQKRLKEAIESYRTGSYASATKEKPKLAHVEWPERKMQPPNYIIIGATKCGTTSLHQYLKSHPDMLLPQRKELDFFLNKLFSSGKEWYLSHFPSITDTPGFYTGEASPNYLDHVGAEQRIYEMFPNMKLIVLLRNPVFRAISAHYHRVKDGNETRTLKTAVIQEISTLSPLTDDQLMQRSCGYPSTVFGGLYVYKLKRWLSVFPRDQILILKSENFFKNTGESMQQVYDFLSIPAVPTATRGKYNVGSYPDAESDVRQILSDFFRPHTRRLEEYLGMDFEWD